MARLRDLVERADKGEEETVPAIRKILDENPDLAWRLRNIGKLAERLLLSKISRDEDLAAKEAMEHQLESMRLEIAGENPAPLEILLAERIVATWLQVQIFEDLYVSGIGKHTLSQGNYYQKRLDRAHTNHLSAIRAGTDPQDGAGGADQHSREADQLFGIAVTRSCRCGKSRE